MAYFPSLPDDAGVRQHETRGQVPGAAVSACIRNSITQRRITDTQAIAVWNLF